MPMHLPRRGRLWMLASSLSLQSMPLLLALPSTHLNMRTFGKWSNSFPVCSPDSQRRFSHAFATLCMGLLCLFVSHSPRLQCFRQQHQHRSSCCGGTFAVAQELRYSSQSISWSLSWKTRGGESTTTSATWKSVIAWFWPSEFHTCTMFFAIWCGVALCLLGKARLEFCFKQTGRVLMAQSASQVVATILGIYLISFAC